MGVNRSQPLGDEAWPSTFRRLPGFSRILRQHKAILPGLANPLCASAYLSNRANLRTLWIWFRRLNAYRVIRLMVASDSLANCFCSLRASG